MAEVEMSHEDNISGSLSTFDDKKDDTVLAGEIQQDRVDDLLMPKPAAPLVDREPTDEVDERAEILPTFTLSSDGVKEINSPDNGQDTDDEAIANSLPSQTKPEINGLATMASSVIPEGSGEFNTGFDEKPAVNGLATGPLMPTPSSETPEGFEELTAGVDEEPHNDKKDGILRSPLALWIMKQNLHPQVVRLIYWAELRRTTGVFGGALLLLLSLRFYSLIGVVMTFALSLLVVAFLYRIGMTIVKAVQQTSAEHPFKHLLEEKIEISEEGMQYWSTKARKFINEGIRQTQCLFLVKDTVASLKALILFWLISYIASCIDFLSICILGIVLLFTVPKLYEEKQKEIDQFYSIVKEKSCLACGMIEDKLPEKMKGYLKKAKSE